MSEGEGGGAVAQALESVQGQNGAGGEGGGGEGGGQQQQQQDRWQDKFLREDLRGNETLGNYKSIDDMATGLLETQRWGRGRIAVPAADADATAFSEFASKVRPEKADAYTIVDEKGEASETGEAFRNVFHEAGLHPFQAQMLNSAWNQYAADAVSKQTQAGRDELTAIEMEFGPQGYNQRLTAVDNMLRGAGLDYADLLPTMEQAHGAGKAMKALMTLAEKTGELAKVDGASVAMRMGAMDAKAAEAEIDRMDADPAIRAKVGDKGSAEYRRREDLMAIVRRG